MNKSYTYADFITESMNYQHSQEYYGIMKEMAEIELMSSYLASQQFLAEEAEYYDFSEGVLMEAGDTDQVKTKLGEKAKNLIKKIVEALKKAWEVFVKFIKSIPEKVKGLISKIKGTKAADSLQFVADKAKSDPKTTEILYKKFSDIIDIPGIYTGWKISTQTRGRYINDISDNAKVVDSMDLKHFTKVCKVLANFINKEDNAKEDTIDVFFKLKLDRNKLDRPVFISYSAISYIINIIINDTKEMTELKDIDKVYDRVKNNLMGPLSSSLVDVELGDPMQAENSILKLNDKFTQITDSLLAAVNESVDPKEIKALDEIDQLIAWTFTEYMIATKHAFKLITDILKVSAKIYEAYGIVEKKNN